MQIVLSDAARDFRTDLVLEDPTAEAVDDGAVELILRTPLRVDLQGADEGASVQLLEQSRRAFSDNREQTGWCGRICNDRRHVCPLWPGVCGTMPQI